MEQGRKDSKLAQANQGSGNSGGRGGNGSDDDQMVAAGSSRDDR